MKLPLRWRLALFYALGMALMFLALALVTHHHIDHELRVETIERSHPLHPDWVLHAAFRDDEIDDILGELYELWSFTMLPVIVAGVFVGLAIARNALRPVQQLNRQLASIGPDSLNSRVSASEADPEFQHLSQQINGLLGRIQAGYDALSAYSTTVAHELRTPIMLMRLQIEKSGDTISPTLAEELQDELTRLGGYIERTLLSAKAEQGKLASELRPVDIAASIHDLAEGHALLAAEAGRHVLMDLPGSAIAHTDPFALRHILDNLIGNAIRHGAGDIHIRLRPCEQELVLLIVNHLPASPRRRGASPGIGLGIRLITALVHTLPGTRYSRHQGNSWYAACLRIPVMPPATRQPARAED